jgi:hypothetical protein
MPPPAPLPCGAGCFVFNRRFALMKKFFYLLVAVCVVFVGVVVFGLLSVNPLVKKGVEYFGPRYVGADVRLAESDLSILSGEGELRGLFVGNPAGYKSESAVQADSIRMKLDTSSLSEPTVIIEAIVIDRPVITYELAGRTSNLQTLVDNVTRSAKGGDAGSGGGESAEAGDAGGKSVVIKHIVIRNARVNFGIAALGGELAHAELDDIHLRDIGEKKDVSMADAARQVLTAINRAVAQRLPGVTGGLEDGVKKGVDAINGTLRSVGEGLRGILK